jgi:hypothetical protein
LPRLIYLILPALLVVLVALPTVRSEAIEVPETLSHRTPVGVGIVEPGFPIDYVGVIWDRPDHDHSHAHDHDHDAESHGAIRFRTDGAWGPWIPLIEDGADGPGHWASGLVAGDRADAYQIRGVPHAAERPRAVALNTIDGPRITIGHRPAGAEFAVGNCVSREEWGADESLRADDDDFVFFDVQLTTVHHTATRNNDPNPEGTVRAIYEYHTVDRGWDDIGYNYLIDEDGRVYEGRWSGEDSTRCEGGGDGSDFAHFGDGDQAVRGAHAGGYNTGNVGVALLGEFTTHPRWGADPAPAAIDALEDVLAHLMVRHDLDPQGTVDYANDVNQKDDADTITGHTDWVATECPGARLYDRLPEIRESIASAIAGHDDSGDDDTGDDDTGDDTGDDDTGGGTGDEGGETSSVTVGFDGSFSGGRNQDRHLSVTVTIREGDETVDGVQITGVITADDGGERSFSGTTGSDGTVEWSWNNAPSTADCFTATVTGIAADGWDGEEASGAVCRSD